jgi:hypothetical protein
LIVRLEACAQALQPRQPVLPERSVQQGLPLLKRACRGVTVLLGQLRRCHALQGAIVLIPQQKQHAQLVRIVWLQPHRTLIARLDTFV